MLGESQHSYSEETQTRTKDSGLYFLGYAPHSIGYRFLVVKSEILDMHVDTIMESRDATFFENMFPMKDMHSTARISSEIIPESSTSNDHSEQPLETVLEKDDNEAPKRSKRQRIEKSFGDDFIVYLVDNTPTSIAEAYASPDSGTALLKYLWLSLC